MVNLDYKEINLRIGVILLRKVQALNINNSYRSLNLNTRLDYDKVQKVIQVTRLNEDKILEQIKNGTVDKDARYILYHFDKGIGENDTLNEKLMKLNVPISYYTATVVPLHIIKGLANNKRGEAVYQIAKEFTSEQVKNVYMASQLCRTAVSCPLVYPDIDATSILFSMWDLRYIIDRLDLYFPPILNGSYQNSRQKYYDSTDGKRHFLNETYKLNYYVALHEVLARWRIQLWLVCDSKSEMTYLESEGEKRSHELR